MSSKKQNHHKKFKDEWREEFSHGREGFFHGREEIDHGIGESVHGIEEFKHDHHPQHEHHQHHECQECQEHHEHMDEDKDCICSLLKRIFKAQEEVDECQCKVSCERSIRQLLSPTDCPPNTVPFTLTCGCDLFCGKAAIYGSNGNFCLISSPFFKVKKVDHNCCAVLELLWPTSNGEPFKGQLKCMDNTSFPCNHFNGFIGTGACITVDLSCICSISYQKPHMVDKATTSQIQKIIKGQQCEKCEKNYV